jgi:hypothetical protein
LSELSSTPKRKAINNTGETQKKQSKSKLPHNAEIKKDAATKLAEPRRVSSRTQILHCAVGQKQNKTKQNNKVE